MRLGYLFFFSGEKDAFSCSVVFRAVGLGAKRNCIIQSSLL